MLVHQLALALGVHQYKQPVILCPPTKMATTNAAITVNFPYPVFTALGTTNTDPTFNTLQVVQVQLNDNAASIHSDHGHGVNGHLASTTTPADYALRSINRVTFTPPTNHPALPAHSDDATSAQIADDNRAHAHQQHNFKHYHTVNKILQNQRIAAVPAIYIAALRDPVIAFGNTTTLELLTHLHDTYGGIDGGTDGCTDEMNTVTMKDQWQPPTYIEVLYLLIEDSIDFPLAGDDPKSEPIILRMAYNNETRDRGIMLIPPREKPKADPTMCLVDHTYDPGGW
jgi:hypothetical protein